MHSDRALLETTTDHSVSDSLSGDDESKLGTTNDEIYERGDTGGELEKEALASRSLEAGLASRPRRRKKRKSAKNCYT